MPHLSDELLNTYLDDMMDETARRNIEVHLAACEPCRAQLEEMETLFASLEELPDGPLSHDLTPGILARLPKTAQIPALWRQPGFMVQALLTLVLLGLSFPMLSTLGQQITKWSNGIALPALRFPVMPELIEQLTSLLTWKFRIPFSLPALPSFPFSLDADVVLILAISAGVLWMIGNLSLLRTRPEGQE